MAAPIQRITQAPTAQISQMENVSVGLTTLQGFELAQRAAKLMASSTLVPAQYRSRIEKKDRNGDVIHIENPNAIANCVVALNMAARMNADPLMVMQNLYIVEGRPSWSSQWIIAAINNCNRFSPLRFEIKDLGEKSVEYTSTVWENKQKRQVTDKIKVHDFECIAWAVEKATGERIESPTVSIGMAVKEGWFQKNGSKWQTMPEVMLRYRASSFFGKLYAPELLMGIQSVEENEDAFVAYRNESGTFEVKDEPDSPINADIVDPTTGEILDERTAQAVSVDEEPTDPLIDLRLALEDCHSQSDIARFIEDLDPKDKKDPTIQELVRERQAIIKAEKEVA